MRQGGPGPSMAKRLTRREFIYTTPALDALARQGIKLTSAYAAAPVCTPTMKRRVAVWNAEMLPRPPA